MKVTICSAAKVELEETSSRLSIQQALNGKLSSAVESNMSRQQELHAQQHAQIQLIRSEAGSSATFSGQICFIWPRYIIYLAKRGSAYGQILFPQK